MGYLGHHNVLRTNREAAFFSVGQPPSVSPPSVPLCHSERSEESLQHAVKTLRCAQGDKGASGGDTEGGQGATSIVNFCVATPTLCVPVDTIFSNPQLKERESSLRTSRSIVAVTTTGPFPGPSGMPESRPVPSSILSHAGPCFRAKRGVS